VTPTLSIGRKDSQAGRGGRKENKQIRSLEQADVIVGNPGGADRQAGREGSKECRLEFQDKQARQEGSKDGPSPKDRQEEERRQQMH
jgi:hypothetical protein